MQRLAREAVARGQTIGLVPTMGYLHEGHLSLVRRLRSHCDLVVVSLFVNPAQFGPREDLARYPRDAAGDRKKIAAAGGDLVFMPSTETVYPKSFETYVTVERLTTVLEGAARPDHFRGVTTVVAMLYNIVRPDHVIFGMKDFQQAVVLKRMTADLHYPIRYHIGATVREADGLAMSSRNSYFTSEQRLEAVALYRSLQTARAMAASGTVRTTAIEREMRAALLATCPTAKIEYVAFNDFTTLEPVRSLRPNVVVSLAAVVHGVRLIDNLKLS